MSVTSAAVRAVELNAPLIASSQAGGVCRTEEAGGYLHDATSENE